MELSRTYIKKRREFGCQPLFCEQGPVLCDSIPPDIDEQKFYMLRNPVHQTIQHTPCYSQHDVNTIRAQYSSSGANHSEGGWPEGINIHDPEATQRYRRRVEKDDDYIRCVNATAPGIEHYIFQNNAIDMYRAYYVEMGQFPEVESPSIRTMNHYQDKHNRPVTAIAWEPESHQRFAANYTHVDFYLETKGSKSALIWNIDISNRPESKLKPPAAMFDLQYSPRDKNFLVGALATGQAAFWDQRTSDRPVSLSAMHVAHREIARSVKFTHSKTGMECFTGSSDGTIKWWDLRNLSEPTEEIIIDLVKMSTEKQSMAKAFGVSVVEYEPTIPTRFMVGTENGLIVGGNRKGKSPLEKLPFKLDAHDGPIFALQRNPSFPKNFLSVGDWRFKIWSEECRESAILWSKPMRNKITFGEWSPTRLSLLFLTSADGYLTLYDLIRSQTKPVLDLKVSKDPLNTMRVHEKGMLVAAGDDSGAVTLMELSHSLVESKPEDKQILGAVFERESHREHILEAKRREIRLKMRQAEETSPAASLSEVDHTLGDRDLAEAQTDYMAQIKKELQLLGLQSTT